MNTSTHPPESSPDDSSYLSRQTGIRHVFARLSSAALIDVNPAAVALVASIPLVWMSLSALFGDSTGEIAGELVERTAQVANGCTLVLGYLLLLCRWKNARDVFLAIAVLAASLRAVEAHRASVESDARPVTAERF